MEWLIVTTLAVVALAGVFDLRERRIPPVLSYFLLFFGLFYHAGQSAASGSLLPLAQSASVTVAAFAFAYLLYWRGFWAGGDTKLFTGLAAVMPAYGGFAFFPFWAFAAGVLVALPVTGAWLAVAVAASKKLRQEASRLFKQHLQASLAYGLLFSAISWLFFSAYLSAPTVDAASAAGFVVFSCFSALGFVGLRVARKAFRTRVRVRDLRLGMVLSQPVKVGRVRVLALARGVTAQEIALLRRAGVQKVVVTRSLPFTPFFGLAVFVLVLLKGF